MRGSEQRGVEVGSGVDDDMRLFRVAPLGQKISSWLEVSKEPMVETRVTWNWLNVATVLAGRQTDQRLQKEFIVRWWEK